MCSSNLKVGFGSFSCICVWKTVEYFNQYSYRNWHGVDLSDSRNSLRTDRMVDLLLHAQWRGRQSLLPCMAGCLAADGWPSNKPNYFWFCMKLISMQGCWVSVWISNGFSLFSLSLSFPFLPSACHENTSTDVNHIPGKCYLCWAEGLLCKEWWWAATRDRNHILPHESVQDKFSYWAPWGLDCKVFDKRGIS